MPRTTRPPDGELVVHLYGKLADLIRAESRRRDMGHDQLVRDIILCWDIDLRKSRRASLQIEETLEERIGDIE